MKAFLVPPDIEGLGFAGEEFTKVYCKGFGISPELLSALNLLPEPNIPIPQPA